MIIDKDFFLTNFEKLPFLVKKKKKKYIKKKK